ncbi:DNA alkylation repair protein [Vandammella animalimorsus]|uniref:DNA alkylation repair protein n=1 Tax=Vandammella animalimorsus TaxID=2029117 RepID=A0A3M6RLQ6_9BURK|nr:DNA alkylation repair protein [Vandammella animalimorsus]RMX15944.1 DNA alkylation repair protein [Vandammella animalimorsus]
MNANRLLAELKRHANPERAAPMAAYMKHRFDYLGIAKPQLVAICKPFFKEAAQADVDWRFIEQCWASPWREMQYAALHYLKAVQQKLTPQDVPRLQWLITEKSWWDTVDFLDRIVGGIARLHPEVNAVLLAWSQSDNIWLRRVAIDHQLLRKDQTDTALLERILCNNLGQREFFINKAIGWALRDYSKTNPQWVRAFIDQHRNRMAALSIHEASKYL